MFFFSWVKWAKQVFHGINGQKTPIRRGSVPAPMMPLKLAVPPKLKETALRIERLPDGEVASFHG